jgi:hypothetical protein
VDAFIKPVSDCHNYFTLDLEDHKFVDLDRVVKFCVKTIYDQLPKATTSVDRVPPLALVRLARGGKTITLASVFDELKTNTSVNPILISFNGQGTNPFELRAGESQSQAILRLIAVQLDDYTPEQTLNLVVDREALDLHLGDNVVLLIDELNNLGMPLDSDAAKLLRQMFLDRARRHLVFTSHFPVSIESKKIGASEFLGNATVPPSSRLVITVDMPLAGTLSELRGMSVECEALTEERAAWLAYIPSLTYCTMKDAKAPSVRFSQMDITVETSEQQDLLKRFVSELLSGRRDPVVARYYGAFASVDAKFQVSYPLCYVKEILKQLEVIPAVTAILEILSKLENNLNSKHSGIAWQCTVEVAIVLRMLKAAWVGSGGPFDMVPPETYPKLAFRTLVDECDTVEKARGLMDSMIAEYKSPTLIYVGSANAQFPAVEGFVAYTSGCLATAKIVGFQVKAGKALPGDNIDTSVINGGGVLFRGRVMAKNPKKKEGWTYMTAEQVRNFLGNSLLLSMPRNWLPDPQSKSKSQRK